MIDRRLRWTLIVLAAFGTAVALCALIIQSWPNQALSGHDCVGDHQTASVGESTTGASETPMTLPSSSVIIPATDVRGYFSISAGNVTTELIDLLNEELPDEDQINSDCAAQAVGISEHSLVVLRPCWRHQAWGYALRSGRRPVLETIEYNDHFTHAGYVRIGPRLPPALLLAGRSGNRETHLGLAILLRDERSGRLYDTIGDISQRLTVWTLADVNDDGASELVALEGCTLSACRLARAGARYRFTRDARLSASRIEPGAAP